MSRSLLHAVRYLWDALLIPKRSSGARSDPGSGGAGSLPCRSASGAPAAQPRCNLTRPRGAGAAAGPGRSRRAAGTAPSAPLAPGPAGGGSARPPRPRWQAGAAEEGEGGRPGLTWPRPRWTESRPRARPQVRGDAGAGAAPRCSRARPALPARERTRLRAGVGAAGKQKSCGEAPPPSPLPSGQPDPAGPGPPGGCSRPGRSGAFGATGVPPVPRSGEGAGNARAAGVTCPVAAPVPQALRSPQPLCGAGRGARSRSSPVGSAAAERSLRAARSLFRARPAAPGTSEPARTLPQRGSGSGGPGASAPSRHSQRRKRRIPALQF